MTEQHETSEPTDRTRPRSLDDMVKAVLAQVPHDLPNEPATGPPNTRAQELPALAQRYLIKSRPPIEKMWDQTRPGKSEPVNEPMAGSVLAERTEAALRLFQGGVAQNPATANDPVWQQANLVLGGVYGLAQTYDPDDLLPPDRRLSFEVLAAALAQTMDTTATAQNETANPTAHQALLEGVRLASEVFTAACLDQQFPE